MASKLLKGRGLWLQVSCKSFPTVYSRHNSPLCRPRENDLQLLHVHKGGKYLYTKVGSTCTQRWEVHSNFQGRKHSTWP